MSQPAPATVRAAGALLGAEGSVGVLIAVVLIIRAALGEDQTVASGVGTALWFVIFGGAVAVAGVALFRGRRWGRTIALVSQLLLVPVVWSLLTDSHQPLYGVALGIVVAGSLVLLFLPTSNRWAAETY